MLKITALDSINMMLYHKTSGNGKHLVLLHGFCENSTCFNKQVLLLMGQYTVTVIDLPGAGNSPVIPDLSMEKAADAVYETLQQSGINNCVMVGHSMGGYVTLAYAKKYAHTLKGFGLLHSTANADSEERKIKRDQAIRVIEEKGMDFYVRNFIPPLFAEGLNDKALLEEITHEGLRTSPEGLKAALLAMKQRPDSRNLIASTSLPVLFVAGKQDAIIPSMDLFKQAETAGKAKVVYLQHSGHMGMIEEAEICAEGIRTFANYCFANG